jgi:hypothetical protein
MPPGWQGQPATIIGWCDMRSAMDHDCCGGSGGCITDVALVIGWPDADLGWKIGFAGPDNGHLFDDKHGCRGAWYLLPRAALLVTDEPAPVASCFDNPEEHESDCQGDCCDPPK